MINNSGNKNISFGSTYTINFANNPNKYNAVGEIEDKYCNTKGFRAYINFPSSKNKGSATYVVPDKLDKAIEAHLRNNGIRFQRLTKKELLDKKNIIKRIVLDDYSKDSGFKLVKLDTKMFDKSFKLNPNKYVGRNGKNGFPAKNGFPSRYEGVKEYLKSNQPIHASIVHLRETYQGLEVCFTDGRHRYSVLRDMGFKSIPFAIDPDSLKLAKLYKMIR